jgi:uncharacterized protein YjbJ (UPF0337 family)
MADRKYGFGSDSKPVVKARDSAMSLAQLTLNLMEAWGDLKTARGKVLEYTAEWARDRYSEEVQAATADAQEAFNRAADDFEDAVARSACERCGKCGGGE